MSCSIRPTKCTKGEAVSDYRYGFNGKENDPSFGDQIIQDYGFRLYNPAIAKFLSVDPLAPEYPWNSTYAFAEGDVIRSVDLDGLEKKVITFWIDVNTELGSPLVAMTTSIDFTHERAETWVQYKYLQNEQTIHLTKILDEGIYTGGRDELAPSSLYDYTDYQDVALMEYMNSAYRAAGGSQADIIARDNKALDKLWDDLEDMSTLLGFITVSQAAKILDKGRLPNNLVKSGFGFNPFRHSTSRKIKWLRENDPSNELLQNLDNARAIKQAGENEVKALRAEMKEIKKDLSKYRRHYNAGMKEDAAAEIKELQQEIDQNINIELGRTLEKSAFRDIKNFTIPE